MKCGLNSSLKFIIICFILLIQNLVNNAIAINCKNPLNDPYEKLKKKFQKFQSPPRPAGIPHPIEKNVIPDYDQGDRFFQKGDIEAEAAFAIGERVQLVEFGTHGRVKVEGEVLSYPDSETIKLKKDDGSVVTLKADDYQFKRRWEDRHEAKRKAQFEYEKQREKNEKARIKKEKAEKEKKRREEELRLAQERAERMAKEARKKEALDKFKRLLFSEKIKEKAKKVKESFKAKTKRPEIKFEEYFTKRAIPPTKDEMIKSIKANDWVTFKSKSGKIYSAQVIGSPENVDVPILQLKFASGRKTAIYDLDRIDWSTFRKGQEEVLLKFKGIKQKVAGKIEDTTNKGIIFRPNDSPASLEIDYKNIDLKNSQKISKPIISVLSKRGNPYVGRVLRNDENGTVFEFLDGSTTFLQPLKLDPATFREGGGHYKFESASGNTVVSGLFLGYKDDKILVLPKGSSKVQELRLNRMDFINKPPIPLK